MDIAFQIFNRVDELAFILGLAACSLFYQCYRKCCLDLEREEIIDRFLQD